MRGSWWSGATAEGPAIGRVSTGRRLQNAAIARVGAAGSSPSQVVLSPRAPSLRQTMIPVAIGAHFGIGRGEYQLVLWSVEFLLGMAGHARRIDPVPGIHDLRSGAVSARAPGFVRDMGIADAMAMGAADVLTGVIRGDGLFRIIDVADEASTVVGRRSGCCLTLLGVIKQQEGAWARGLSGGSTIARDSVAPWVAMADCAVVSLCLQPAVVKAASRQAKVQYITGMRMCTGNIMRIVHSQRICRRRPNQTYSQFLSH